MKSRSTPARVSSGRVSVLASDRLMLKVGVCPCRISPEPALQEELDASRRELCLSHQRAALQIMSNQRQLVSMQNTACLLWVKAVSANCATERANGKPATPTSCLENGRSIECEPCVPGVDAEDLNELEAQAVKCRELRNLLFPDGASINQRYTTSANASSNNPRHVTRTATNNLEQACPQRPERNPSMMGS